MLQEPSRSRLRLVKIVRLVVWLIGVGVLLPLVVFALSPRDSLPYRITNRPVLIIGAVVKLPVWMLQSDVHCRGAGTLARMVIDVIRDDRRELELASRTLVTQDGYSRISTPRGEYWIPARDKPTLFEMIAEQQSEVYEQGGVRINPGDIVLDCGANVGVSVKTALARGAGLVVAIEPAPQPLECLRRNLESEIREGRVIVYPKGVWDKDAELTLTVNPNLASTAGSVAIDRGQQAERISLTTIDRIVQELKLPRVDFIKMDIEGAEGPALRGALKTVQTFHPRMAIALEHRPTDPADLGALVPGLWPGYEATCGQCFMLEGHVQPMVLFAKFGSAR